MQYKLTEYSHGAGCGCKLSPGVLSEILETNDKPMFFKDLLVGNETKDDAAVVSLDGKTAIISTTDFFMPIVDDPYHFGAIAATNAISDIYAMGGEPIMAIAILGWPIDKLPAEVAGEVLKGGRDVCNKAGIPLAGGHSIDCPEPIFGLAVTGKISVKDVKKNTAGQAGDLLYLTKPLGIGVIATAQKKNIVKEDDLKEAKKWMLTLNTIGQKLGQLDYVHALTDVTGFGLGGHLIEICEGSELAANIHRDEIPVMDCVPYYLGLGSIPGGTNRNWKAYGEKIKLSHRDDYQIIADPQTSGGLLISVDQAFKDEFEHFMIKNGYPIRPIGTLTEPRENQFKIVVE
jgi:selenide,water dikinase